MAIQERGTVRDGAIVFERPLALPDETYVNVSIQTAGAPAEQEPLEYVEQVEDLATLPIVGMWKDREDMADSVEWVNNQRDQWNRNPAPTE
jgi:hypothetical protein